MFLLENPTRSYEWGSRTAIADLLGREAATHPQAEMWIGAHPDSPSGIVDSAGDLLSRLREDPRGLLGGRAYDRFGDRLPYLLKVLAVERPLSLQVHPDRRHAAAGFDAEREDPASARMFKDPHDKPELLYAVSEFQALCGLRPAAESRDLFERLSRNASAVPTFAQIAHLLDDPGDEAALNKASAYIARLAPDEVAAAVGWLSAFDADPADRALTHAAGLAAAYPEHPAVLLTLLLRHVTLRPGEALAVEPGTPHTYLRGVAVELTTCSDNTIRAGLTSKHVDIERFIDVVDFRPVRSVPVRAERGPGEHVLTTGHPEFELAVLRPSPGTTVRWNPKPRTVLVLEGRIELTSASVAVGLGRGESVFVPANAGVVELRGDGHAVGATTEL